MDNKLSELKAAALAATPGPWMKIDYFWIGRAGAINSEFITCDNGPDAEYIKRVSPDAILALLAELEAKDKRITALDVRNAELNSRMDSWAVDRAESANRIDELEARLATPVRLAEKYNMKMAGDKSTKSMFYGHNSAINDSAKAIRAAGFKCVGDE